MIQKVIFRQQGKHCFFNDGIGVLGSSFMVIMVIFMIIIMIIIISNLYYRILLVSNLIEEGTIQCRYTGVARSSLQWALGQHI